MDTRNTDQILIFTHRICLSIIHIIFLLFDKPHKMKQSLDLAAFKSFCLFNEHQDISLTFLSLWHGSCIMIISTFFPEQARLTVLMADMSWHPVTAQAIPMLSLIFHLIFRLTKDIHKENLFLRLPLIVLVLPLTSRSLETLRQLQDQYPYIYYQLQTINLITCGSPPYQNTFLIICKCWDSRIHQFFLDRFRIVFIERSKITISLYLAFLKSYCLLHLFQ